MRTWGHVCLLLAGGSCVSLWVYRGVEGSTSSLVFCLVLLTVESRAEELFCSLLSTKGNLNMSRSQREGQSAGWGSWALEDETLSSSRLPAWRRRGHTGPFTFRGDFHVRLSMMGTAAPPFPAPRPLGSPSHHTRWECSGTFMFLQCFIPSLKCFQFG